MNATTNRPRHRRLILIDIENLLGCEPREASDGLFELAFESALETLQYNDSHDQVIVGVGPRALLQVAGFVSHHRLVVRDGESGADRALVETVADADHVASRYDEIVVASGDHEFVQTLVQFKARGVRTVIASRPAGTNSTLALVADAQVDLVGAVDLAGYALAA